MTREFKRQVFDIDGETFETVHASAVDDTTFMYVYRSSKTAEGEWDDEGYMFMRPLLVPETPQIRIEEGRIFWVDSDGEEV